MAQEIDPNVIAASVLTDLIRSMLSDFKESAATILSRAWRSVSEDFDRYLRESYARTRYVRILSQKSSDVDLYSVYVPSRFRSGDKKVTDNSLISSVRDGARVVIIGNGGAGKTFFMRHLWQSIFASPEGRIPLFVELRKLNEKPQLTLSDFLRASISSKKTIDAISFEALLECGGFVLVMDGFDEVQLERRDDLQLEILDLAFSFPRLPMAISSRADARFSGWQSFHVYESEPFDLRQVRRLIKNVPFYEDTRKQFLKILTKQFFSQHLDFLSNPLLSIMMLMTFRDNADVPRKMSIFYDQAFNTLFQWHDATKAYSRVKSMDIDQFRRSFGFFCLLSYFREMYEFSHSDAMATIKEANVLAGVHCTLEETLRDFREGVNLLRQDGLIYLFIHRSFQEYFSALAIVRFVPEKFPILAESIVRRGADSVLRLCFEMAPDLVVREFVAPNMPAMRALLPHNNTHPLAFLTTAGVQFSLHVMADEAEGRRARAGVGISVRLPEPTASIVNALGGLYTMRRPGPFAPSYIYEQLLDHHLFDVLNEFPGRLTMGVVTMSFADERLHASSPEGEHQLKGELLREIEEYLNGHTELFAGISRTVESRIAEMVSYWEDQCVQLQSRGRSLDLLLDRVQGRD